MDKELQTRFDSLPADIQTALQSTDIIEKLQAIGRAHDLHTDQLGGLEACVSRIMLGIDKTDDFVESIENNLNVTTDDAINIATEVNTTIFLPVRESLMKMQAAGTETPAISNEPTVDEHPMKADILAEIEDPKPVAQPISSIRPAPTPATPVNTALPTIEPSHLPTTASQPKPTPTFQTPAPKPQSSSVTNEFIAGKMTETVNMPPQKYSADPYREPLN